MRRLLLALPAVAVGIVLWAVLTAGWARPVDVARVVGGPTRGSTTLSWLLSIEHQDEGQRRPSSERPIRLELQAGTLRAAWSGRTDRSGYAEARIELARALELDPSVRIEATDTGTILAEGAAALTGENWRQGARQRGGWLPGQQHGELWLRVAPAEGTLAVPFSTELVIEVTSGAALGSAPGGLMSGAQPAAGIPIALELSGAERTSGVPLLETGADGRARVGIRPLEHAVVLRAWVPGAASAAPARGQWYGALPVTPGALHAALAGSRLVVRSPIARDHAFVSLVDRQRRLAGYSLELSPDSDGGASASLELAPELLARVANEALFAVVSSEPDKRSASAVGWPLQPNAQPALTFDVADRLLLDGSDGVRARERQARLERRQIAAALLALVGSLMLGVFAHELRRPRSASGAAPPDPTTELVFTPQRWWIILALGCLLCGVVLLTYFGLLQR
ncbi:MAG: hypothetical protein ABI895_42835 [Deltaproteobacteria bacterium]